MHHITLRTKDKLQKDILTFWWNFLIFGSIYKAKHFQILDIKVVLNRGFPTQHGLEQKHVH